MANLYIYPKGGEPSTYPLSSRRVTIGRAATNDIVLSDQYSSGLHAVIAQTERGFALIDQGSKNGTFVNGRRVTGEIDLARGDEILIGSTSFFFDRLSLFRPSRVSSACTPLVVRGRSVMTGQTMAPRFINK